VRRMTVALQPTLPIGQERVRRYMREMGLMAIYPGPNLSRRGQAEYIYPYLLRGLAIERANQVWGIEVDCQVLCKRAGGIIWPACEYDGT